MPEHAHSLFDRARKVDKEGDKKEAQMLYDKLLRNYPQSPEASVASRYLKEARLSDAERAALAKRREKDQITEVKKSLLRKKRNLAAAAIATAVILPYLFISIKYGAAGKIRDFIITAGIIALAKVIARVLIPEEKRQEVAPD
jgi:hypothetical protein